MICESCGSEWFLEERTFRPAGHPRRQHTSLPAREVRYRYRCAGCSHIYGEPVKRRGRPRKEKD